MLGPEWKQAYQRGEMADEARFTHPLPIGALSNQLMTQIKTQGIN